MSTVEQLQQGLQYQDYAIRVHLSATTAQELLEKIDNALCYKGDSTLVKWTRILHTRTYDGEIPPEQFIDEFDKGVEA